MLFATGTTSFYVLRFLLGVVESGFFPGVMLYLTFWYPQERRAGIIGMFMSANPLSGVLAGPVSGWILGGTHDLGLLRPWQLLFLVEGLPSVVAGIATLLYLVDSPAQASAEPRRARHHRGRPGTGREFQADPRLVPSWLPRRVP
jgi:MFS family permease